MTAANFHTIHSAKLAGAGLIIGKSYGDYFDFPFSGDKANNWEKSWGKATKFAEWGSVDDTANLNGQPVFIISGLKDTIVPPDK